MGDQGSGDPDAKRLSKAKNFVDKLKRKYNKGKALGIFTHKLDQADYYDCAPLPAG